VEGLYHCHYANEEWLLQIGMDRYAKLYVIASSHPCATAEAALRLKGIRYRVAELPTEFHGVHQRLRFGGPTAPSMVLDGERVIGSRAIVGNFVNGIARMPLATSG
jgi:hypothetical protein